MESLLYFGKGNVIMQQTCGECFGEGMAAAFENGFKAWDSVKFNFKLWALAS
ncbi:hypothetical protein [Paenibacillus illinoisensis]|uniref:hypothetical protein n=1 Tax=Paenibacillus illinoisensis TaxID=59845 RepID=UPI00301CBFC1